MSKTAEKAAEREGLITRNWVLGACVAVLFLIAQGTLTYIMTNAAAEIKQTNLVLAQLTGTVKEEAVRNEALRERVRELETARGEAAKVHREIELRLNSLEQRAAVHDQWIQSHNR